MIKRTVSSRVIRYSKQYPVIMITGPRQSGKTTIAKALFPRKKYISLEAMEIREYAAADPKGFLAQCPDGAIIDEVQRVPLLTSYIQTIVDEKDKAGMFILTGSQSFELMSSLSQSLAGRMAIVRLLPFSLEEAYGGPVKNKIEEILYRGFYPRIHDKKLNPTEASSFYTSAYIERDIRSIIKVQDLLRFETFLKLCAGRTGQLLNLTSLGNDCGISHNTAKSWITLLEASFIIKLLPPYHANLNKRLVKSPKLYFIDTGLAAFLMGINAPGQIAAHPLRGNLFETFVFSELLKARYNEGKTENLYFFRDSHGVEVDFIIEEGNVLHCYEAKSSATLNPEMLNGLFFLKKNIKKEIILNVIYGGDESCKREGVMVQAWNTGFKKANSRKKK
ncbi:ATP-binding protein [bacterium]|nr:ATP-binding protein [bacterium]MBU3956316.1 ATP-binding protein [bacterium]